MESAGGRQEKLEGHCSTGQSPQWAVVPMEEGEGGQLLVSEEVLRSMHLLVTDCVCHGVLFAGETS